MKKEYLELEDLLSCTIDSDKMDYDEVLNMITMKKNIQLAKKKHTYPIHYTEASGWFTKVDDTSQPTGKRKIRRCSEDNIKRLKASWNAYYLDEPLSKIILERPLCRIPPLVLREWAESLLKKHYPVDKKKFSRMFTIINQCFEYASDEEQVFTDEERRLLKTMVEEDLIRYRKQPTCAGLQILFLFETGLRIGECCGLKWTDIRNNRLYIRRQANNDGVKEWTKSTAGYRDIPLTTEAQRILQLVEAYNQEHEFTAEWLFQSSNSNYDYRISYNAADRKL